MFDNSVRRVGFACKYMHDDQTVHKKLLDSIERDYNGRSTTKAWLNRQTQSVAEDKLHEIINFNIQSYSNLIEYVGALDPQRRMLRLGSELLPLFTEATWGAFYTPSVRSSVAQQLAPLGARARELDIKLSMHPGQFTVLASADDDIVTRSLEEFEYHALVASYMGFGKEFQDFKINVHISGRRGPDGIKAAIKRMSPEARRMLTIENEEVSWGLDDILELEKECALVFDIHHHWVHENEYLDPQSDRFQRVIASWRGVRPTVHYSVSRQDYIKDLCDADTLPDRDQLLEHGKKTQKLRAHSDKMWNRAVNDHAAKFWPYADIMVEAKHKNIAAELLHDHFIESN